MSRPKLPRDAEGNIIRETPKEAESVGEEYAVTLSIGADVYNSAGATICEALSRITPLSFGKGFARITVTYKGKESQIPIKIFPIKLQRIFGKKYEMELFCKRLRTLL